MSFCTSVHEFSRASLVAQTVKKMCLHSRKPRFDPCWEDPLEKGMATHSSILALGIPWTEEPGQLQSIGLQSRTQLSD